MNMRNRSECENANDDVPVSDGGRAKKSQEPLHMNLCDHQPIRSITGP